MGGMVLSAAGGGYGDEVAQRVPMIPSRSPVPVKRGSATGLQCCSLSAAFVAGAHSAISPLMRKKKPRR
jgi:hypothetical protein